MHRPHPVQARPRDIEEKSQKAIEEQSEQQNEEKKQEQPVAVTPLEKNAVAPASKNGQAGSEQGGESMAPGFADQVDAAANGFDSQRAEILKVMNEAFNILQCQ